MFPFSDTALLWIGFNLFVLALLALDLGVFHRQAHAVSTREAAGWTIVWISLVFLFGVGVWALRGAEKGLEFFTGYLIEYSLSVDNIFVFAHPVRGSVTHVCSHRWQKNRPSSR